MQFFSFTTLTVFISLISSSYGVTVSHDSTYSLASASLNDVACSDGPNGLVTRGYKTLGSIPNFPFIGGSSTVEGWNSVKCGACYKLTYTKQKRSVYITAIDRTNDGFNVAQQAFEKLVGPAGTGKADVEVQEVHESFCGFK